MSRGAVCLLLTIALAIALRVGVIATRSSKSPKLDLNGFAGAAGLLSAAGAASFGAAASGASDFAGALLGPPAKKFSMSSLLLCHLFQLQLLEISTSFHGQIDEQMA